MYGNHGTASAPASKLVVVKWPNGTIRAATVATNVFACSRSAHTPEHRPTCQLRNGA